MSDDRSMAPPDRLAMLEARVTELEKRLHIGEHAFAPRTAPRYELAEQPGQKLDWAVIRELIQ